MIEESTLSAWHSLLRSIMDMHQTRRDFHSAKILPIFKELIDILHGALQQSNINHQIINFISLIRAFFHKIVKAPTQYSSPAKMLRILAGLQKG